MADTSQLGMCLIWCSDLFSDWTGNDDWGTVELLVVPGFGRILSCSARIISTWEARSFPMPAIPVVGLGGS